MANMKELNVTLKVDTKDGEKQISKFNGSLDKVEKGVNKSSGSLSKMGKMGSTAFKGIGTAFKAIGFGLILSAFALLFETIKKNQKVMDTFTNILNTAGIIFNQIFNTISDVVGSVSEATGGFDAMGKVLKSAVLIPLNLLQISFNGIKWGILQAQLIWEESFLGSGDEETINKLNKNIDDTEENLKDLTKEIAKNSIELVTNLGEAVDEVVTLTKAVTTAVIEDVSNMNIKTISETAKAATEAVKNFERLEKERARIQLQAQKDAEIQRQIRDDETKSFDERIAANQKLGDILAKQGEDEKKINDEKIASIKLRQQVEGDNVELQNELIELQNERLDIEERLTGQASEQLVNQNSLNKEKLQQEQDYQTELEELKSEAYLSGIENKEEREAEQLEKEQEAAEEELENRLETAEITETQYQELLQATRDKFDAERLDKKLEQDDALAESEETNKRNRIKSKQGLIKGLATLAGEETALGKSLLIAGQAIAIADITTSTIKSAVQNTAQATAAAPPPLNVPLIAVATGQNVINGIGAGVAVGNIIAQTASQLGAFEQGGVVPGNSFSGDNVLARLNSEEVVLNTAQSANLLFKLANEKSSTGGGGMNEKQIVDIIVNTIGQIPVNVLESDITTTQRNVSVIENSFSVK